jgi:hypothetical protein
MFSHRASAATHPKGPDAAPKAGCFCAVAALRIFADALHRHAKRA